MAHAPAFPVNAGKDLPPFLNDGQSTVEYFEGRIVDGPPNEPIPAFVFDMKVLESDNPMNVAGQIHTVRVKCRGFSWGETVQQIVGAAGTLPKASISNEVAEGLMVAGTLKGRKFIIQQATKSGPKKNQPTVTVTWREFKCAPLEKTPVL